MTASAPVVDAAPDAQHTNRAHVVATRAGVGLATVAAIYLGFVATATGQRFDDAAKLYAVTNQIHYRRLETLASVVVVAAVVMAVAAHARWAPRRAGALAWTACAVLPPWLLAELGKVTLPRHHLHATPPWIGGAGFPSGHVAITASCVLTAVLLAPPRLRRPTAALAACTVAASATLVITSGMHRPSDVYAAPVLALTWAAGLTAGVAPARPTWSRAARRGLAAAATLAVVGGALGSAALRSVAAGPQLLPAQTVIDHTLYGAVLLALAVAAAVGIVACELLGRAEVVSPGSRWWARHSPTSSGSGRTSAA